MAGRAEKSSIVTLSVTVLIGSKFGEPVRMVILQKQLQGIGGFNDMGSVSLVTVACMTGGR